MSEHLTERRIPLILIAAGIVLSAVAAAWRLGLARVPLILLIVAFGTVFGTLLMVAAAYVTAAFTHTGFGELRSAVLKLAAVYLFPSAVSALFPLWAGLLVSGAISFSLLIWLFDLEVHEAQTFTAVEMAVNLLVVLAIIALIV